MLTFMTRLHHDSHFFSGSSTDTRPDELSAVAVAHLEPQDRGQRHYVSPCPLLNLATAAITVCHAFR